MKKYLIFLIFLITITGCKKIQTDFTETDRKIIQDYITSHGLTNVQSTASGMYYVIEKPGTTTHPNVYSTVTVTYTGRLANDTIFDTTVGGSPATFALSGVIQGWQIGIPLIGRGGKCKLMIPSSLGYGGVAQYGIPKNSVLVFDISLLDYY